MSPTTPSRSLKGLPPRILYVHNSADRYGASRSLLRLLPQVQERGFRPLVVLPEVGPLNEELARLGMEVVVDRRLPVITRSIFSPPKLIAFFVLVPLSVCRLHRLIRRNRIALVHTNTGVVFSPALAARLAGVAHIWHIRDSFLEFRRLWRPYRRFITGLSARVVAVSNPIAAQFPGAANVVVIHNGIPLAEFPDDTAAMRARFRDTYQLGDGLVVGCLGRIKLVRKGQEVLVHAAALLKRRGVRAKYLIVGAPAPGSEAHLPKLQRMIAEAGLGEDIVLTGELQDPWPAYSAMDVFVLPSAQPEPFGGVVLEAMGMKLPVVATAIGGSLDQLDDGKTGFLVPPANPEALADRLAPLLADAALRRAMGEAGRKRLETCFAVDRMADKTLAVYEELLRNWRTGASV